MSVVAEAGAAAELLRSPRRRMRAAGMVPYLLLLPAAVLVLGITAYPIVDLFRVAFHATRYFRVGEWNGGANFLPLATASGMRSVLSSAVFVAASDAVTLAVALGLALVLEGPLHGRGLLRTLVMAPWLVSQVVTALMWQGLFDPNFGPVTTVFIRWWGTRCRRSATGTAPCPSWWSPMSGGPTRLRPS